MSKYTHGSVELEDQDRTTYLFRMYQHKSTLPLKRPTRSPIILVLVYLFLASSALSAQQGRLAIRQEGGKARFYNSMTDERFTPRGFNYIQLVLSPAGPYGESELFQPDSHDQIAVDDDFQRISALGYNVVRVFVDLCRDTRCIANTNGLDPAYMQNIVRLLERARQYDLYVMLTANWLPDVGGYSAPAHQLCEASGDFYGGNCLVMSSKGVELYGKFFSDFVMSLKDQGAPMETIWAYELRNEFFVEHNELPFTKTSGMVTTANGMSYNMASASDKIKMGEDAVVYWANSTRNAIKAVDPDALVTSGFFTPNKPNILRPGDQRIVPFVAALQRSELDFFGIHAYAGFEGFELGAENYGIIGYTAKPIVLGEYGAFLPNAPDEYIAAQLIDHWQSDACSYGIEAFTMWTWDRHRLPVMNADDPWAGSDVGAFIAKVISPFNKVNSCDVTLPTVNVAEDKPTDASMSWSGFPSANVVDGNATQTPWIAGGDPPQWVEVDLLNPHDLAAIQIVVETGSNDPFQYTHEIQVKTEKTDDYETIHTFSGARVNFEVLTYPADGDGYIPGVRFVRVLIPQAPGWAALHELRALLPQERSPYDVPPPPILTFPRPGMDAFSGSVVTWKNDLAHLNAQIQLATDPAFQNIVDQASNINTDEYPIGHLDTYDVLYWRVRQSNSDGTSYWSITGVVDRTVVATKDADSKDLLSIYPNPVDGLLHLGLVDGLVVGSAAVIYAIDGTAIPCTISVKKVVDLTNLAPGIYLIRMRLEDRFVQGRFVKQ
jgi:hypothetical protein